MATRNLTAVINKKGEVIVKQYGHWDGYPSGVGLDVLKFITTENNLSLLENQLKNCFIISGNEAYANFIAGLFSTEYELWIKFFGGRDVSANVLNNIIKNTENDIIKLRHYSKGEYIEWSWVINFQTNRLECYDGDFTQTKMLISFDLDNLPNEEDFLFSFKPDKDFQVNGYKIKKTKTGWQVKKGKAILEEFTHKYRARNFARNN